MKSFYRIISVVLVVLMTFSCIGVAASASELTSIATGSADAQKIYSDFIASSDETDSYSFKVNKKGYISIAFSCEYTAKSQETEPSEDKTVFHIQLSQNGSKATIVSYDAECPTTDFISPKIGLEAGNYVLTVSALKFDETSDNTYSFAVNAAITDGYEAEPNNSEAQSNEISTEKAVAASLFDSADEDWFAFTTGETQNITLKLNTNITGSQGEWLCYVYNSKDSGKAVASGSFTAKEAAELTIEKAEKGTYYVRVIAGTDYSANDYKISLKLETPENLFADFVGVMFRFFEKIHNIDTSGLEKTFGFVKSIDWLAAFTAIVGAVKSVIAFIKIMNK